MCPTRFRCRDRSDASRISAIGRRRRGGHPCGRRSNRTRGCRRPSTTGRTRQEASASLATVGSPPRRRSPFPGRDVLTGPPRAGRVLLLRGRSARAGSRTDELGRGRRSGCAGAEQCGRAVHSRRPCDPAIHARSRRLRLPWTTPRTSRADGACGPIGRCPRQRWIGRRPPRSSRRVSGRLRESAALSESLRARSDEGRVRRRWPPR